MPDFEESSSTALSKGPCECGSSDAKVLYSDGHSFCFSCQTFFKSADDDKAQPAPAPKKPDGLIDGGYYADLEARSLFEKTLRKFGYQFGTLGEEPCHIAPYHDKNGRVVAQKIRLPNKQFRVLGDLRTAGLFGEQLWDASGKRLVVTEGEIDALSYAQITPGWPCVSVPNGAAGAAKAIKKSLEFVESFEEVVFLFDNDGPGQDAARECADLLVPGKAKIARLGLKDANEMLVAGQVAELKKCVYNAKTYRPDGVVMGADLDLAELMESTPRGLDLPYHRLNSAIRGLRKRELMMICAGSGIGKSTLARELGVHLAGVHQQRVGWVMLEESLTKTVQSIVAIDHDVPIGDLMENPHLLEEADWRRSMETLVARAAFYDAWGSTEVDNLISKLRYLAVGCEVDWIVIDHVSMVVSGLDTDERKTLDILMTKLRTFIEQTGVGVIGVVHLKRPGGGRESFNEGGQVSLTDLRGSAGLEQLSDIVVALERDQQDKEDSHVSRVRLLKNRPFGIVGHCGDVAYHPTSGRLLPHNEERNEPDKVQPDAVPF